MRKHNRNIDIIKHIGTDCQEIKETLESFHCDFDVDFDVFEQNHIYKNACSMYVLQIGELVKHLSPEFTQAYDEIPWRIIRSMPNRFSHDYTNADIQILLDTLSRDIPDLLSFCEKIITQYNLLEKDALRARDFK
ncbi:HepT-like ribonuclease domain-containing protein [Eubacterium aggregans]|uniref:HepT-like ribonuclease domain-containing protein n=1 Tax=Eubacterium aggregans TaxID=81409 RepID=UPI003F34E968